MPENDTKGTKVSSLIEFFNNIDQYGSKDFYSIDTESTKTSQSNHSVSSSSPKSENIPTLDQDVKTSLTTKNLIKDSSIQKPHKKINYIERALKNAEPNTKHKKRLCALNEILTTERTYLKDLKTLNSVFCLPIKVSLDGPKPLLPKNSFNLIFGNLSPIIEINSELLSALEKASSISLSLGAVFDQFAPYLKIYQNYVNDFDAASEAHSKALQSSSSQRYAEFIEKAQRLSLSNSPSNLSNNNNNNNNNNKEEKEVGNFLSHFIKPVQRIPRYRMLIREALKYTPNDDSDFKSLTNALEKIKETATIINQKMKENEARRQLLLIRTKFSYSDAEKIKILPTRLFVKMGFLKKKSRRGEFSNYVFILFSDILLYATETQFGKLVLHRILDLKETCNLRDNESFGSFLEGERNSSSSFSSFMNNKNKNKNEKGIEKEKESEFIIETNMKSFVVRAKNRKEKEEWKEMIEKTVRELKVSERKNERALKSINKGKLNSKKLMNKINSNNKKFSENYKTKNKNGKEEREEMSKGNEWKNEVKKGAPVWMEDNASNYCLICGGEFGFLKRKHHCRRCGKLVCADCSKKKAVLEGWYENKAVRVCSRCHYLVNNRETFVN